MLYRRLLAIRPEVVRGDQFASLVEFAAQPAEPLLVEARDIAVGSLRTEQGSGMDFLLDRIERGLEDPDLYDLLVGQHNFELIQSVPSDQLSFHSVRKVLEFDGEGGSREVLEFQPFKPL